MRSLSRYYQKSILLVIVFFHGMNSSSQQGGHIFYNLTTANGLSSNRTTSVIQDKQGFYWIGTLDGLNRFDGTNCKIFQNIQQDSTSLSHNHCISVLEDDNNDIWVATLMGLNRYRNDGRFDRFFLNNPHENFERANWILGMIKDNSGNIWVTSCGLWQYNIHTKKWRQWLHDPNNINSIPAGSISSPVYDSSNNFIWMSGSNGYVLFEINSGKFYHKKNNPRNIALLNYDGYGLPIILDKKRIWFFINTEMKIFQYSIIKNKIEHAPFLIPRGIYSLNQDNKSRIWVNFWYGPSYIYDPFDHSIDSVFLDAYHAKSAVSNNAKSLFIDQYDNYWISTWNGIVIFNPSAQALKYHVINNLQHGSLKESFAITALAEQNDSTIWLGTSSGLYQYNLYKRNLIFKNQFQPLSKAGYVRCLFFQNDSLLWIGGWTELLCYNTKRNRIIHTFNNIGLPQCISKDQEENIWVGTWRNGIYRISSGKLTMHFIKKDPPAESIYSNYLVCFGSDRQKESLWMGYNGGDGFSNINFQTQQFRHYKINANKRDNFPSNAINCMWQDEKKRLWLGTFGRGIICFDPVTGSHKNIMQSDGLNNNFINSILADDEARLWISTSTGINILDTKNNDIIQTDINLSFTTNDFIGNGIVRKNKKLLFFAGNQLVEIDPFNYYRTAKSYNILLSSFRIFDKEKHLSAITNNEGKVKLTYRQNFFSIDYSLLKTNPDSRTQYAYQLDGFDKEWNYVKDRRTAYYTNVPPGEYKFVVKATDEMGKWVYFSKPLAITIVPPFWQKAWFIAAVLFILISAVLIFYRYRIRQLKKIFAIRSKISQDLHDELGATLSSIHIYSSVATKAMEKDADTTKDALLQINENTRQVMENMSDIVWAINANKGQHTTLASKLKNYGYELLTPLNINCDYRIDKDVEKKLVNMEARKNILLIAKEAINNIAKYSGATQATVKLEISDGKLLLEITDNGDGIAVENNHTGQGLYSMRQRAEAMQGSFQIRTTRNSGTVITCNVPLTTISGN